MTSSDENLLNRNGNGRRYDDLKAGSEKYLFGGLQIVVILMLAWGGTNVIDNGKALVRVETKMTIYAVRVEQLSQRIQSLEKIR